MKKSIKNVILIFLFVFSVVTTFYGNSNNSIILEKVIARINENFITLSEFESFYKIYKNRISDGDTTDIRKRLLFSLIDYELLFQIAKDYNLEVNEHDIQDALKNYQKSLGVVTPQAFMDALKKNGTSLESLRFEIKVNKTQTNLFFYIINNHLIKDPQEYEIKQKYIQHKDEFYEKEKVKLSHILIKVKANESFAHVNAKEKLAVNILSWIKSGKEDFETAAKKYSDDRKNKNRGGMLGWYDKTNLEKLTKKYAEIAFSLKVGEVSHIIISDEAIHIIKVLDKKPSRLIPYSEAKKMIMSAIIRERASKQLQNMIEIKKKRSDIDIFL